MEAELKDEFPDCTVELVMGDKGIFDVTMDDSMVFSKYEQSRFPEQGEIPRLVKEMI